MLDYNVHLIQKHYEVLKNFYWSPVYMFVVLFGFGIIWYFLLSIGGKGERPPGSLDAFPSFYWDWAQEPFLTTRYHFILTYVIFLLFYFLGFLFL